MEVQLMLMMTVEVVEVVVESVAAKEEVAEKTSACLAATAEVAVPLQDLVEPNGRLTDSYAVGNLVASLQHDPSSVHTL